MSGHGPAATALAVIGSLGFAVSAHGQDLCPDGDLIPAEISGLTQLSVISIDEPGEGDIGGESAFRARYCPTTGCFFWLGDGEVLTTNVGFRVFRDDRGALTMESCEAPSSPRPFKATFFQSDPEMLPAGMDNPAPDADNCIRESMRHKTDDGEPGGFLDICLVHDGDPTAPFLLTRKNSGPFVAVPFDPVVPGAPGECDQVQLPGVGVDSLTGRFMAHITLPTGAFPDCMVTLAPEGEAPIVEVGTGGLPQPARGDIDGDGDVDIDDVRMVLALRNQPARPPGDRADVDGNGVITVGDARSVVLLCDQRGCARP